MLKPPRMKKLEFRPLAASALAAGAALCMSNCAGPPPASAPVGPSASTAPSGRRAEPVIAFFVEPKQGGAALWAAHCNRCHNAPPPSTFRPDEWDLVLNHMRLRAT